MKQSKQDNELYTIGETAKLIGLSYKQLRYIVTHRKTHAIFKEHGKLLKTYFPKDLIDQIVETKNIDLIYKD